MWTAVDARADRTTALHATQLASVLTLELGDAEGGARMNALAWAAIERDGSPPDLVARYWFARSLAERHTGSPDAELDAARKAVAAAEGLPAGPPWNMLCNLAAALAGQEHLDEALATLARAAALGAGDEADAAIESLRAEVHSALGDDAQALAHAERAVALATRVHGPTHPSTLEARHYLGAVLIPIDPARAVAELKSALAATGGHENLAVLGLVAALASAEAASGDPAAAEVRLLDLLAELDAHGDVPATDIASVWADLGDVRAAMHVTDLAADAYSTALARLPPGPYAETLRADIEARRDALSPRPR